MLSRLQAFQSKNVPSAKGSETHLIPNERLPSGGLLDASGDAAGFAEALASEIAASRAGGQRFCVYERLHPTFRFFLKLAMPSVDAGLVERIFRVCAIAMHEDSRGENVFFPRLDLEALRCVVLHDQAHLRFVFPDVLVDSSRALRLHRHVLECLNAHLTPQEKLRIFADTVTTKAFAVLPLDAWRTASPNDVYLDSSMGMAVCGGTAVVRCTAAARRGKMAHRDCAECERTGYLPVNGRLEVVAVLRNGREPATDAVETQRLRDEPAAALAATTLRCADAAPTEPFLVPSYAPPVPMQVDRHGRNELTDCFECERSTFGSASKNTRRHEYDPKSNNVEDIRTMTSTQAACRRMHPAYGRVTIKKMYRLAGTRPLVRVQVDGLNATFCMGRQRVHEGRHACRASFTIEMVKGKAQIYQECFSPECLSVGKKRYCSDAKPIAPHLATQLGFVSAVSEDGLERRAAKLFDQMRDLAR